jgi:hypothetical protein
MLVSDVTGPLSDWGENTQRTADTEVSEKGNLAVVGEAMLYVRDVERRAG